MDKIKINETKLFKIADLKPYPKNAKIHSNEQIRELAESIKLFGFNGALVIDKDNVLVAGHGRYEALKMLGVDEVPCTQIIGAPEEVDFYRIIDNTTNRPDYNYDILREEMQRITVKLDPSIDVSIFKIDVQIEEIDIDQEKEIKSNASNNNAIFQYNIVFDTDTQMNEFLEFIKKIKVKYSEFETIGGALEHYIKSNPVK